MAQQISIEIVVSVEDQDIDDIMGTALDSGISYWCCKAEPVGAYLGEYASDQISRGGELRFYDSEARTEFGDRLNRTSFMRGLKEFLSYHTESIQPDGSLDTGDIDAEAADAIVQMALFGEVVYG